MKIRKIAATIGGFSLPALMLSQADAQLINDGSTSFTLNAGESLSHDLNGDGEDDFLLEYIIGVPGEGIEQDSVEVTGSFAEELNEIRFFDLLDTIDQADSFSSTLINFITDLPTTNETTQFVGIRFDPDLNDGNPDLTNLGKFALAFDTASQTLIIDNFGYQSTPGANLIINVPEPTTLSALAVGAAGLLAGGRRRK